MNSNDDAKKRVDQLAEEEMWLEKLRKTFGTQDGQDVLFWIFGICGLHADQYTGNSKTFYNLGKQETGNMIMRQILAADEEIYFSMIRRSVHNSKKGGNHARG